LQALRGFVSDSWAFLLKKPNPVGFILVLSFIRFLWIFYLNNKLVSLLVDLAHLLSFYLD